MARFRAALVAVKGGGHYVVVPPTVAERVGLASGARVKGTVNGEPYRSSLMKYSGIYHLGVHKAVIAAAGAATGDTLAIAIELDDAPLPGDVAPKDLLAAIKRSQAARVGWDALAPSHKREHVKWVLEAKKPETRARRIAKVVADAEEKARKL